MVPLDLTIFGRFGASKDGNALCFMIPHIQQTWGLFPSLLFLVPWALRENAEESKLQIYCFTGSFPRAPFPIQAHTLHCAWTPGLTSRVLFLSPVSVSVSSLST